VLVGLAAPENKDTVMDAELAYCLKSKYITIDGPDGCGKTAQTATLVSELTKADVVAVNTREPNEPYRSIIVNGEAPNTHVELLVAFASLISNNVKISEYLGNGNTVVSDRGELSLVMYQGFLRKEDINLYPIDWFPTRSMQKPDIRFLICTPKKIRLERMQSRGTLDRLDNKSTRLDPYFADFNLDVLVGDHKTTIGNEAGEILFGPLSFVSWSNYLTKHNRDLPGWHSYRYLYNRNYNNIYCIRDNGESVEAIQERIQQALCHYYGVGEFDHSDCILEH
jgi:dTMP kinase